MTRHEYLDVTTMREDLILSATISPDIKHALVAMSDRTGMSFSQVSDEVLFTGLIEMQELPELEE